MLHNNEKVLAYKIQGKRHDIGTPVGWIKAVIHQALQSPIYSLEIKNFIQEKLNYKFSNSKEKNNHLQE